MSERHSGLRFYWDQSTDLKEDSWDVWYEANTSFDYLEMYKRGPTRKSTTGFDSFDKFSQMLKLWPRENVYVYVLNRAETAQEFQISYSGAHASLVTWTAAAFSAIFLLSL